MILIHFWWANFHKGRVLSLVWQDGFFFKKKKKLMLVLIERYQCLTVFCEWGCIAADQSVWPYWPRSTAKNDLSIRTWSRGNGKRWPGLMTHIFFISYGWLGVCASLTWRTSSTRMHYGEKLSGQRQCIALGSVLLGSLLSWHQGGFYFEIYNLPKHCCRWCTSFYGNCIPWWPWPLSIW